jgi:hypothetical protein
MPSNHSQQIAASQAIPKELPIGTPPSPPPHAGAANTNGQRWLYGMEQQLRLPNHAHVNILPHTDTDDGGEEELHSPITIRVNAAVRVSSSNNIVFLSTRPSRKDRDLTAAVLGAIKAVSSAQCGIPMIDEDGRPRPVRVEIDAGIEVRGFGNLVGPESAVLVELEARRQLRLGEYSKRERGEEAEDGNGGGEAARSGRRAKRAKSV